jgi:hypothetical protein
MHLMHMCVQACVYAQVHGYACTGMCVLVLGDVHTCALCGCKCIGTGHMNEPFYLHKENYRFLEQFLIKFKTIFMSS